MSLPHYSPAINDDMFIQRNIQLASSSTLDIPDYFLSSHRYIYPGELTRDVAATMTKNDYEDWKRQERIRRGEVCPGDKFWNDLNTGRTGYERGTSDNMDHTIYERNNFGSGWLNAKCGGGFPGACPYRNPNIENLCMPSYNPDKYIDRVVPMNNFGSKHYFYSLHDIDKWPKTVNRCQNEAYVDNTAYMYNCKFGEKYY